MQIHLRPRVEPARSLRRQHAAAACASRPYRRDVVTLQWSMSRWACAAGEGAHSSGEVWADAAASPLATAPEPLGPPPQQQVSSSAESPWHMVQSAGPVARHGKLTKLGGKQKDKWQEIDAHLSSAIGLSWTLGSALQDRVAGSQKTLAPKQLLSAAYYSEIGTEFAFEVVSTAKGGKVYKFAASSDTERDDWINAIETVAKQDAMQLAPAVVSKITDVGTTANPLTQHTDDCDAMDPSSMGSTDAEAQPKRQRSRLIGFCLRLSWCVLILLLGVVYQSSCVGECGTHGSCAGFRCTCMGNFVGVHCDESCGDHGVSENGVCTCKNEFFGRSCSANCGEHGTIHLHGQVCSCSTGYPSGRCCPPGRDGATCEVRLEPSGYAPAYILSGCVGERECGTFVRTSSTCTGAPVYQLGADLDRPVRKSTFTASGDPLPGATLLFLTVYPHTFCYGNQSDYTDSDVYVHWTTSFMKAPPPNNPDVSYLRSAPVHATAAGPPTAPDFSNSCGWMDERVPIENEYHSCFFSPWKRIEVVATEA